jgi:hypothetical protein
MKDEPAVDSKRRNDVSKILTIVFVCVVLINGAHPKSYNNSINGEKRYVTAKSGLIMRSDHDVAATAIITIPFSGEVTVIGEFDVIQTIAGASGKWTKVECLGKKGWVFGGFLSTVQVPDLIGSWDDVDPANPGPGGSSPSFYRSGKCAIFKQEGGYFGTWSVDNQTGLLTIKVAHEVNGSVDSIMEYQYKIKTISRGHVIFDPVSSSDYFPINGEYWKSNRGIDENN